MTTVDYGTTVSCTSDLDVSGNLISGIRVLSEALTRRLLTPRGRLLDDPDYGYDVTGLINADMTSQEINQISGQIDTEIMKDERVTNSSTTAVLNSLPGNVVSLTTTTTVTTGSGPFRLVLNVSAITVQLLSMTPIASITS